MPAARVALLTATAMLAFAANSLLCRQALLYTAIDAASFTGIRLVSGAIALSAFIAVRQKRWPAGGSWISAAALTLYAACFSFAYRSLTAATGALLLFAAVQLSMLGFALIRGARFAFNQGIGLILAAAGLTVLLLPGVASPSTTGALLMSVAGLAWGCYSLRSGAEDPAQTTAANFLRSVPMALTLMLLFARDTSIDWQGFILAVASGALTSGIGYLIWYAALREITTMTASVVQLSVPAIASLLGVILLGERMSDRLAIALVLILLGIGLAARRSFPQLIGAKVKM